MVLLWRPSRSWRWWRCSSSACSTSRRATRPRSSPAIRRRPPTSSASARASASNGPSSCSSANGLWRILHGDLGTSIFTNLPVTNLIAQRIEPTLSLMLVTLVLAIGVAVPLGVVAAWKAGSLIDRAGHGLRRVRLLGAGLRGRLPARLRLRARARLAARAGLHADRARVLALAPEPDPAGDRARRRLHRADRPHDPRHHARGAAAGLHQHRARQGPRRRAASCSSTP